MTLLLIEGFDHFDTSALANRKGWVFQGPGNYQNFVAGRIDGGALSMATFPGTFDASAMKALPATYTQFVFGFAIKIPGLPSDDDAFFADVRHGTTQIFRIHITTIGHVAVADGSATIVATGTRILPVNVWNYIELKGVIAGASGSCATAINGAADIATTTHNFGSTALDNIRLNKTTRFNQDSPAYFDDVYFADTSAAPNDDFLGDVHVETIWPNGDTAVGGHLAWTPSGGGSHYAKVDDPTPDDDATTVSDNVVNDIDLYQYPDLSISAGTIFGIQTNLHARKDDGDTRSIAPLIRRSGTDYVGDDFVLAADWINGTEIFEEDPSTSAAWTITGFNAAEIGVKLTV